jgi:hypothetical protein
LTVTAIWTCSARRLIYDHKIAWYENDGSETFTERTITTSANGATSVFAADVDGDGDLDVLSASNEDDKIAWYENLGASISGVKYEDQDGDGMKDQDEPGLEGWTLQLDLDADGSVDLTTQTAADGSYSFADVSPGTHRIREVLQQGWTQTTADPDDVTVVSGQDVNDIDFGNFALVLDVDGNSAPAALTDGLLIIRYLAGFRGQALISDAVAPDATRTTAGQIEALLEIASPVYGDVDDSGSALALTDGLLIIRFLAGFTGAALVADATAGPRSDPADIVAFLNPFLAPPVQQGLAGPADDQTHDVLADVSPLLLQFDENRSVRQGPVAIDHTQVGAARFAG